MPRQAAAIDLKKAEDHPQADHSGSPAGGGALQDLPDARQRALGPLPSPKGLPAGRGQPEISAKIEISPLIRKCREGIMR